MILKSRATFNATRPRAPSAKVARPPDSVNGCLRVYSHAEAPSLSGDKSAAAGSPNADGEEG